MCGQESGSKACQKNLLDKGQKSIPCRHNQWQQWKQHTLTKQCKSKTKQQRRAGTSYQEDQENVHQCQKSLVLRGHNRPPIWNAHCCAHPLSNLNSRRQNKRPKKRQMQRKQSQRSQRLQQRWVRWRTTNLEMVSRHVSKRKSRTISNN